MPYPVPSKSLQLKRLASTPGKGVGAGGTGHGTADINVPEMPPPPAGLNAQQQRKWQDDWGRWRENLAAQFPIPMVQSEKPQTAAEVKAAAVASAVVIRQVVLETARENPPTAPAPVEEVDLTEIYYRLAAIESQIALINTKINEIESSGSDLNGRIVILEDLVLDVTPERLLGRHSSMQGPMQEIKIGPGLDLVGDTLVTTGGGGTPVSAFTAGFDEGYE